MTRESKDSEVMDYFHNDPRCNKIVITSRHATKEASQLHVKLGIAAKMPYVILFFKMPSTFTFSPRSQTSTMAWNRHDA